MLSDILLGTEFKIKFIFIKYFFITISKEHSELVKEHFEVKYYDYDKLIQNLIPKYTEMHNLVVHFVEFPKDKELSILDLGVGTGKPLYPCSKNFQTPI